MQVRREVSPLRRVAPISMRALPALLGLIALSLAGCSGRSGGSERTHLTRHPDWDYQRYPRVALVPMRASADIVRQPGIAEAAAAAADVLRDELSATHAFQVQDRSLLKDVLTEQDLSRLADVADPSTIIPAGKIQAAQAIIVPSITVYDLKATREQFERPIYLRDRYGRLVFDARTGHPVVVRVEVIPKFRHEAHVAGAVRVIDTTTGTTVFAYTSPPISFDSSATGAPPRLRPEDLAARAARELAIDLAKRLAPQEVRVKLDSDMLIVARDYYDGRYENARKLPLGLEEFVVAVIGLPRACDRNDFRVTVVPRGGRTEVFHAEFVWSANDAERGRQFRVPTKPLRENGAAEFTVKLYSGRDEAPLLTRDVALEAVR